MLRKAVVALLAFVDVFSRALTFRARESVEARSAGWAVDVRAEVCAAAFAFGAGLGRHQFSAAVVWLPMPRKNPAVSAVALLFVLDDI